MKPKGGKSHSRVVPIHLYPYFSPSKKSPTRKNKNKNKNKNKKKHNV
jgi:hypothetical protein